jgi:hypothetical protein
MILKQAMEIGRQAIALRMEAVHARRAVPQEEIIMAIIRKLSIQGVAFALGAAAISASSVAAAADTSLEEYRARGLEAALQTKAALGGQLKQAIEAGGPEGAVAFCNTRAIPITEETSDKLGVKVTRVSDQPRNPANAASDDELAIIAAYKESLAAGAQPTPEARVHNGEVSAYYPIVTNAMCLKCHGTPGSDISAATQAVLDSQYPDDRATGYGEKQLRGLFVVTMPAN